MQVASLGPLPVGSIWWRRGSGPWTLTVVCKATLELLPGEARLITHPDPLYERERFPGDDHDASPYAPADLSPDKPLVDVTLVGDAFPPADQVGEAIAVRLRVGDLDKTLHVQLEWSDATSSYRSTPLCWELAPGGPGTDIPPGVSPQSGSRPRIQLPPARNSSATLATPGFGPIARHWPARQRLLRLGREPTNGGEGDDVLLADDFDAGFYNAAPPDQQIRALPPQTMIGLYNLHPRHPVLETRLPNLVPQLFVERRDGKLEERPMQVDGLWIDTRRAVATLTWRSHVPVRRREEEGQVWVVVGNSGRRLGFADLSDLVSVMGEVALQRQSAQRPRTRRARDGEEDERMAQTQAMRSASPPAPNPEHTMTASFPVSLGVVEEQTADGGPASSARAPAPAPSHPGSGPAWLRPAGPAPQPAVSRPGAPASGVPFIVPAPHAPRARQAPVQGTPVVEGDAPPADAQRPRHEPDPRPPVEPAAWSTPGEPAVPQPAISLASLARPAAPAGPSPWSTGARREPLEPYDEPATGSGDVAPPVSRRGVRAVEDIVQLLWFDPAATARLRLRFPAVCDALDFAPLDPRHDLPSDDPEQSRAHHLHFGVLTEAPASDVRNLQSDLRDAVSETGRFTAPLLVLAGELELPFDELEVLRATAGALGPLAAEDKKIKDAIGNANEVAESTVLGGAPDVVKNLIVHLRSLYAQAKRSLPNDYLDETVDRCLLAERSYQRKSVFGGVCIRALLTPGSAVAGGGGARPAIPTYLPEALDKQLPLMKSFRARLVAEAHFKQDHYEAHAFALRAVAIGRVLSF